MEHPSKSKNHPKEHLNNLEKFLETYLVKKAPALPKEAKEVLVKIAPWLIIIFAVISVPALFGSLSLITAMSGNPYTGLAMATLAPTFYVAFALSIVVLVLELIALPGLFSRSKKGWDFAFYASLVGALSALLSGNIISFIISALISLYLIFQIKEYYK